MQKMLICGAAAAVVGMLASGFIQDTDFYKKQGESMQALFNFCGAAAAGAGTAYLVGKFI